MIIIRLTVRLADEGILLLGIAPPGRHAASDRSAPPRTTASDSTIDVEQAPDAQEPLLRCSCASTPSTAVPPPQIQQSRLSSTRPPCPAPLLPVDSHTSCCCCCCDHRHRQVTVPLRLRHHNRARRRRRRHPAHHPGLLTYRLLFLYLRCRLLFLRLLRHRRLRGSSSSPPPASASPAPQCPAQAEGRATPMRRGLAHDGTANTPGDPSPDPAPAAPRLGGPC
jgi:hypothetical protein